MAILTKVKYKGICIKQAYVKVCSVNNKRGLVDIDLEISSSINQEKNEVVGTDRIILSEQDSKALMAIIYTAAKKQFKDPIDV